MLDEDPDVSDAEDPADTPKKFELAVADACGKKVLDFIKAKLELVQQNVNATQEIDAEAIIYKV